MDKTVCREEQPSFVNYERIITIVKNLLHCAWLDHCVGSKGLMKFLPMPRSYVIPNNNSVFFLRGQ